MVILTAFGIIFGSAATSFAQVTEPIAGGYGEVSATDKEAVAAANYAARAQAKKQKATIKLVSINRAERQVVAGLNYRLCLKVSVTAKGRKTAKTQVIQTVVFQNLKQKLSLTSWTETNCSQGAAIQTGSIEKRIRQRIPKKAIALRASLKI